MQGFWNLIGKSGQGPGKDFQYDVSEKVSSSFDSKSVWNLHHGKRRTNGDIVSVFVCDAKLVSPDEFHLAKTAHKRLKTVRHPNIIKYLDGFESESLVYVVTEPVIPLSAFLDEEDGRNANLITWGLHQVTAGLSFLINDGNLIHENVNIFSIFVGLDGEWKLGGVEYVHAANTDPVAKLPFLSRYDPPEGRDSRKKEKWSTDAWGLGCLIWEIYNGALQKAADLKVVNKIPKPLVLHYCDLVSANPKSRTNPKAFLEKCSKSGQFLNNNFINANLFLQEIQIKDATEQKEFFTSLDKSLDSFPKQFCVHKVLPQLLNAFEFGSAGSSVLSPLFKVGLLLDDTAYQAKIVPCILKLFSSNDRATRIQLLQQMEKFIKHLQPSVVDNQIFGCVATGFGDTVPAMREQTVKAMLFLAPKLSEKTINNQLLRYFAKLQMDDQPGIRTNTTICLGKAAKYLSNATRQKVLVPAFARAIRDPFPPARTAGLMAISATQEYYSMPDIATKLLPALSSATIDPEKTVRDNAFQVIKMLISKLEKYSNNPESPLNNKEVAEKESRNQASWTGWAVSSLTSKIYKAPQNTSQKSDQQKPDPASVPKPSETTEGKQEGKPRIQLLSSDNEKEESDHSDYGDAWEDEQWEDTKEDFASMKMDLMSVCQEVEEFADKKSLTADKHEHDSDSDYGDWGDANDNWGFESVENKPKKKITPAETTSAKRGKDEQDKSVAELLGMNAGGADFLSEHTKSSGWDDDWSSFDNTSNEEKKSDQFTVKSSPTLSNNSSNNQKDMSVKKISDNDGWQETTGDGWGEEIAWGSDNDWGGNTEFKTKESDKDKRKQELIKKREERRQQRDAANKEKRTIASGGAIKLGAVKKGPKGEV